MLDLLSGTRERSRLPSSARYRSFRAPPRILSRTMSCSSAATEKNFKIEELSLATITARKAPPPCMGLQGSRSAHTFRAAPEAAARSASAEDKEHDCWHGLSRAPARLLLLHAWSHAALDRVDAGAKARGVSCSVSAPIGKSGSRPSGLGKYRDSQGELYHDHGTCTGLLGQEASGLWWRIAAEQKRLSRNFVW